MHELNTWKTVHFGNSCIQHASENVVKISFQEAGK